MLRSISNHEAREGHEEKTILRGLRGLNVFDLRGYAVAVVVRWARRNDRIWRTASGMRSFGSFHGNMLTSAFGASIAASIATLYGCAGMSSGRMSTGVLHCFTKSRVTDQTKPAGVWYIFVRNCSTWAIVTSGWRFT